MKTSNSSVLFFKGAREHRKGAVRMVDEQEFQQYKKRYEARILWEVQANINQPQHEFTRLLLESAWEFEQKTGYEVDGWNILLKQIMYSDEVSIDNVEIIVRL